MAIVEQGKFLETSTDVNKFLAFGTEGYGLRLVCLVRRHQLIKCRCLPTSKL